MDNLLSSPLWPVIGLSVGLIGAVIVAYLNRKPTELQLGATAFEQLHELSDMYRTELADYRSRQIESIAIEQALRRELDVARSEIGELKLELELARREVHLMRLAYQSMSGADQPRGELEA